jgi:hypothetical protein
MTLSWPTLSPWQKRIIADKARDWRCRDVDPGGDRGVADDDRAKIGSADPGGIGQ